jgi:hypothetical protein
MNADQLLLTSGLVETATLAYIRYTQARISRQEAVLERLRREIDRRQTELEVKCGAAMLSSAQLEKLEHKFDDLSLVVYEIAGHLGIPIRRK